MERKKHWETIYETKSPTEVSWYQARPTKSIELIRDSAVDQYAQIIDIGGGASTLVDHLLDEGYRHITVLDLSAKALEKSKQRLGRRADEVKWIEGDVTQVTLPEASYDVWHDRAVFHFLTDAIDQNFYRSALKRSLKPKGNLLITTFASDGPPRCSGLDVVRYSAEGLQKEFGDGFQLVKTVDEVHQTPFETQQKFIYCHFQKK